MRATPATAETIPATIGAESEADPCSEGVVTGLMVEVMPKEGAGVGGGEVAASDRAGAAAGTGGVKAADGQIGCIERGMVAPTASVKNP